MNKHKENKLTARAGEEELFHNPADEEPPITGPGDILAMMARGNAETPEMGHPLSTTIDQDGAFERREETRRKPIVSIHGKDMPEDVEGDKRAA